MTLTKALPIAILSMTLSTGTAFAKAHDSGAADGVSPDSTSGFVQSLDGPGVSSVTSKGARGASASADKGDNGVEPVVGNGKNRN